MKTCTPTATPQPCGHAPPSSSKRRLFFATFLYGHFNSTFANYCVSKVGANCYEICNDRRSSPNLAQKERCQFVLPCWHLVLAMCVRYCWQTVTLGASTACCGRLLYKSTIAKWSENRKLCGRRSPSNDHKVALYVLVRVLLGKLSQIMAKVVRSWGDAGLEPSCGVSL